MKKFRRWVLCTCVKLHKRWFIAASWCERLKTCSLESSVGKNCRKLLIFISVISSLAETWSGSLDAKPHTAARTNFDTNAEEGLIGLVDGLAPARGTTGVCSLLCATILTWGCSLNQKIGFLYQQKPGYNTFFLSDMFFYAKNQEMAVSFLLCSEVSSEKGQYETASAAQACWSWHIRSEDQGLWDVPLQAHHMCPVPTISSGGPHILWTIWLPLVLGKILAHPFQPGLDLPLSRERCLILQLPWCPQLPCFSGWAGTRPGCCTH